MFLNSGFTYVPCNLTIFYYFRENSEEDEKAITKINSSLNAQSDIAMNPELNILFSFNYCCLVGRRASYTYFNNCLKVRSSKRGCLSTHSQKLETIHMEEENRNEKEKRL